MNTLHEYGKVFRIAVMALAVSLAPVFAWGGQELDITLGAGDSFLLRPERTGLSNFVYFSKLGSGTYNTNETLIDSTTVTAPPLTINIGGNVTLDGSYTKSTGIALGSTFAMTSQPPGLLMGGFGPMGLVPSYLILNQVMGVDKDDLTQFFGDPEDMLSSPLQSPQITAPIQILSPTELLSGILGTYSVDVNSTATIGLAFAEDIDDNTGSLPLPANNFAGIYAGFSPGSAVTTINHEGGAIDIDVSRRTENIINMTGMFGIYNESGGITIGEDADITLTSAVGLLVETGGSDGSVTLTNTFGGYNFAIIAGAATAGGDITAKSGVTIENIMQVADTDLGNAETFGITAGLASFSLGVDASNPLDIKAMSKGGDIVAEGPIAIDWRSYIASNNSGDARAIGITSGILSGGNATSKDTISLSMIEHQAWATSGSASIIGVTGGSAALGGDVVAEGGISLEYIRHSANGDYGATATGVVFGAAAVDIESLTVGGFLGSSITADATIVGGDVEFSTIGMSDISTDAISDGPASANTIVVGALGSGNVYDGLAPDDFVDPTVALSGIKTTAQSRRASASSMDIVVGAAALGVEEVSLEFDGGTGGIDFAVKVGAGNVDVSGIFVDGVGNAAFASQSTTPFDFDSSLSGNSNDANITGITLGALATGSVTVDNGIDFSDIERLAQSDQGDASATGLMIGAAALGVANVELSAIPPTAGDPLKVEISGGTVNVGAISFENIQTAALTGGKPGSDADAASIVAGALATGMVKSGDISFTNIGSVAYNEGGDASGMSWASSQTLAVGAAGLGLGANLELTGFPPSVDDILGGLSVGGADSGVVVTGSLEMNGIYSVAVGGKATSPDLDYPADMLYDDLAGGAAMADATTIAIGAIGLDKVELLKKLDGTGGTLSIENVETGANSLERSASANSIVLGLVAAGIDLENLTLSPVKVSAGGGMVMAEGDMTISNVFASAYAERSDASLSVTPDATVIGVTGVALSIGDVTALGKVGVDQVFNVADSVGGSTTVYSGVFGLAAIAADVSLDGGTSVVTSGNIKAEKSIEIASVQDMAYSQAFTNIDLEQPNVDRTFTIETGDAQVYSAAIGALSLGGITANDVIFDGISATAWAEGRDASYNRFFGRICG